VNEHKIVFVLKLKNEKSCFICVAVVIVFGVVLRNNLCSKIKAVALIFTVLAISILLSEGQKEMALQ
jgi:hypothetical protein